MEAYRGVPTEDCADYDIVKRALLKRYTITPKTYRQRFRDLAKNVHATYEEYANQLRETAEKWVHGAGAKTVPDVIDLLCQEQFHRRCLPEVKEWVLDRKPATLGGAAQLADQYVSVRPHWQKRQNGQPQQTVQSPLTHRSRYQPIRVPLAGHRPVLSLEAIRDHLSPTWRRSATAAGRSVTYG